MRLIIDTLHGLHQNRRNDVHAGDQRFNLLWATKDRGLSIQTLTEFALTYPWTDIV